MRKFIGFGLLFGMFSLAAFAQEMRQRLNSSAAISTPGSTAARTPMAGTQPSQETLTVGSAWPAISAARTRPRMA